MSVNLSAMRDLHPRQLALSFRQLLLSQPEGRISAQLLAGVEEGAVPAPVVCTWLSVSQSPVALTDALLQSHSILVRRFAIKRIGKALRKPQWRSYWDYLGGVDGLSSVFVDLSVQDVKFLASAIGRCSNGYGDESKQQQVTELLCGLLGSRYPNKTHDERPLHRHYAKMVPACSPDFIRGLLDQNTSPLLGHFTVDDLLKTQYGLVRRLVLNAIFNGDNRINKHLDYLQPLLKRMPPLPSLETGLSASMSFSLRLLRELCERQGDAGFPSKSFLPSLAEPLLRRALRKRVEMSVVREIVELVFTYLQHHSDAAQPLSAKRGGFLYSVARCWSRSQELFEDDLTSVIGLRQDSRDEIGQYQNLFRAVPRAKRYALLRLLILHTAGLGADISVEEDLRLLRLKKWHCSIFTEIAKDQAAALLKALTRVKPDGSFLPLGTGNTILASGRSPGADYADPLLLLTLLERGQTVALGRAKKAVDEQKRNASTSRAQIDRAFYARSALLWAIASDSPTVYRETVVWARRFIRDPLTSKTIYDSGTTATAEGIALLSGIPFDLSPEWTASKVRSRVLEANKVLLDFFETACQALREPSFAAYDWRAPLMLFRNVVEARMAEAPKLQQTLELSDDELYSTLWSDTLQMLLNVERIALKPGHETLGFNLAKGPLCYNHYGYKPLANPLPSSYRFIDTLAQARNDLWQEIRPTFHPGIAVLPPPWPRGLPIQCLPGPFDVACSSAQGLTPFIAGRAEATVFLESPLALSPCPKDPDVRTAIGRFVDSYTLALQIYVSQGADGNPKTERESSAWVYALRELTGERMSQDEAFRTWKAQFLQGLHLFKPPTDDPHREAENWPMLPADVDPHENTEWNPALHQPQTAESRLLSPAYLDCTLAADPNWVITLSEDFAVPTPHTQGTVPAGIWSLSRFHNLSKVPFPVREGLVASALLFLDSKKGGPSRILASPFPTEVDVRYPPLFLDTDFLLEPKLHERAAREILRSLISIVPPTLLGALAEGTLNVLSSTPEGNSDIASLEQMTYGLLSLLLASDRPQLASNLVLRAIIEQPNASSRHRAVLNVGIARRLRARDAQDLLSSFAASIGSKLEEQAKLARERTRENAKDGVPSTPQLIIKVTTVKYLAQLLNDADFIPPSFAVDALSTLLHRASHLDIRVAVVDSLLAMLGRCGEESSVPLTRRIVSALETIIPLLSGMSERRFMQEEDWAEATQTMTLPGIYEEGSVDVLPPILARLVNWMTLELKWRKEVFNRVLLPVIERSRVSNARWIKIFLSKHQLVVNVSDLPLFPVKPVLLPAILRNYIELVPAFLLDLYHQFVRLNITPPREIARITNKVKNDGDLRASNEGRHWLSLYGHGVSVYHHGGFNLTRTLCRKWKPSSATNGIQIPHVQRLVLEQAEELLQLSDPSFTRWIGFVHDLEPPPGIWYRDEDWQAWVANGKPVLERIISRIHSIRTPEWQRDPQRKPAILPPTLSSRLWLLSYPYHPSATTEYTDNCRIFAEELIALIHEIAARHTTYHESLGHLKAAVARCPAKDKAHVACYLGSLSSVPSSTDIVSLLRVELAESLYTDAVLPADAEVRTFAKAVLGAWRASEVEEIRMKGLRITSQLQRKKPRGEGWGFPAEWSLPRRVPEGQ